MPIIDTDHLHCFYYCCSNPFSKDDHGKRGEFRICAAISSTHRQSHDPRNEDTLWGEILLFFSQCIGGGKRYVGSTFFKSFEDLLFVELKIGAWVYFC